MITNRLSNIFFLSSALVLSGCQTTTLVDKNTCNSQERASLQIPLLSEFSSTGDAVQSASCNKGRMIGYSALLGQSSDGTLFPGSLITWNKHYQDLMAQLAVYNPQEIRDAKTKAEFNALADTKLFADHFILEASQNQVTSAKARSMYEMKKTDPKDFTSEGIYNPKSLCVGTGMFRTCKAPEAVAPAASEPQ